MISCDYYIITLVGNHTVGPGCWVRPVARLHTGDGGSQVTGNGVLNRYVAVIRLVVNDGPVGAGQGRVS